MHVKARRDAASRGKAGCSLAAFNVAAPRTIGAISSLPESQERHRHDGLEVEGLHIPSRMERTSLEWDTSTSCHRRLAERSIRDGVSIVLSILIRGKRTFSSKVNFDRIESTSVGAILMQQAVPARRLR